MSHSVGGLKAPAKLIWRPLQWLSECKGRDVIPPPVEPLHCDVPALRQAEIAAIYSGQRVAGDFYEFLRVGSSRMLFVMLDSPACGRTPGAS